MTDDNWHAIMNVNALGTLIEMQEAARRMINPQIEGGMVLV